jgi:hypothetical protein
MTTPPASSSVPARAPSPVDWREANRALWDERVAIHTRSAYYDIPAFVAGAEALRPFELAEFHPVADILADDGRTVETDYFCTEATVWDEPGTDADSDVEPRVTVCVDWQHGLGDVLSAIAATGLRIEFVHEHDFTLFQRFPVLEGRTEGITRIYRLPEGQPRVPMIYSVRATRPA